MAHSASSDPRAALARLRGSSDGRHAPAIEDPPHLAVDQLSGLRTGPRAMSISS